MSPLAEELGITDNDIKYCLESFLHKIALELFTTGMYTIIACGAIFYIVSANKSKKGKSLCGPAILVAVMWLFAMIHASAQWFFLYNVYIQHGESRDSQFLAATPGHLHDISEDMDIVSVVFAGLLLVVADMIMIWRCWVLYGRAWWVTVLPSLALLAGIVARILHSVDAYATRPVIRTGTTVNWRLVFASMTVFTNVFCTLVIIFRIVSVAGLAKSLRTYRGIIEILVESALLYTTVYLCEIGLEVHAQYFLPASKLDERSLYFQGLLTPVTGIAPTLILARVAAGHARADDNWTHTSLPHIRTTMRSVAESLRFASRSARSGGNSTTTTQVALDTESHSEISSRVC